MKNERANRARLKTYLEQEKLKIFNKSVQGERDKRRMKDLISIERQLAKKGK
mgnify:FL=1